MTRRLVPFTPVLKFDVEPMPAWGLQNGRVIFRCVCGTLSDISRWTVDDDGNVNPSLDHTTGGVCDFHEYIQLENWPKRRSEMT
jgi:hypothetical protein